MAEHQIAGHSPLRDDELEKLFGSLGTYRTVAVAVSGGPDSMALMHLLVRWRKHCITEGHTALPLLSVLTVNHALRKEAREEARFVAVEARKIGLEHVTLEWTGQKPSSGLQAAARQARYRLMASHCERNNIEAIVTAHHRDDQAETLLMRLARGSGIDGLAAMAPCSKVGDRLLYRPLLEIPKTRLISTLEAADLPYKTDNSNDDERFERSRFRAQNAVLAELGLTGEQLARSAQRLNRARQTLDKITDQFLSHHAHLDSAGVCRLHLPAFLKAGEEIALRALARILKIVAGKKQVQLGKIEELADLINTGTNQQFSLEGCLIRCFQDEIVILREYGRIKKSSLTLAPGQEALWDGRYLVGFIMNETPDRETLPHVTVRALGPDGLRKIKQETDPTLQISARTAHALVSFWQADRLVAVPVLEYFAPGYTSSMLFAHLKNTLPDA